MVTRKLARHAHVYLQNVTDNDTLTAVSNTTPLYRQPSSSFVETPCSPLNVEVSSCGRIFSFPTLTWEKGENVSTIVTKVGM